MHFSQTTNDTVAPYVGAWIETYLWQMKIQPLLVAPYVGAWIETCLARVLRPGRRVAPYVGAWIETPVSSSPYLCAVSHPTWVRGLKLRLVFILLIHEMSHPTWVRGLKLSMI